MKYNIICLMWGTKYDSSYVNKLYSALSKNLTIDFDVHCFTDNSNNLNKKIIIHDLPYNLTGWWNKLYLFSKDMPIKGRIFYIDLDTVITGNIDDIVSHNNDFIVLRDFYYQLANGVDNTSMGSGLMSWTAEQHSYIWDSFVANPQQAIQSVYPHGDQRWIQKQQPIRQYWQDLFPNQVVSFKVHCRDGLPSNARIICYHGKPTIPESISNTTRAQWWTIAPQSWIAEFWNDN